jgi:hypothetical protein
VHAHPDLAEVVLALSEFRQGEPRPSVRPDPDAELRWVREAGRVLAVAFPLRFGESSLPLEEALEGGVEVAQGLLEAVVRHLGEERAGLLQFGKVRRLLVVAEGAAAGLPVLRAGAAALAAADGGRLAHGRDAGR